MTMDSIQTRAAWERYLSEESNLNSARDQLVDLLTSIAHKTSNTSTISARVKSARSYLGKLVTPGKATGNWPHVDDLLGARIAFDSNSELKAVLAKLRSSGTLSDLRVEVKSGGARDLFYPGTHVLATVGGSLYSDGKPISVEIQLRTKAQDAWASVSHKLAYKSDVKITARSSRKVWRLVAMMEIFDDEIDELLRLRSRNKEYKLANLRAVADEYFALLTGQVGSGAIRTDLLTLIANSYSIAELEDLSALTSSFVTENSAKLIAGYARFEPSTPGFDSYKDWLGLQPESILIMERASKSPDAIAANVVSTLFEEPVRSVFHAIDAPWPLDD